MLKIHRCAFINVVSVRYIIPPYFYFKINAQEKTYSKKIVYAKVVDLFPTRGNEMFTVILNGERKWLGEGWSEPCLVANTARSYKNKKYKCRHNIYSYVNVVKIKFIVFGFKLTSIKW